MFKKSVFLLLVISSLGIVQAHDCHLFTNTSLQDYDKTLFATATKGHAALQTISPQGLHRALINLKTHCCNANLLNNNTQMLASCSKDQLLIKGRTNYPESPYLFDHLVDVMSRRLQVDGNYEDVPADPQAQLRRKKTDQLAHAAEGTLPPALSKTYQENRALQHTLLLPSYNGVSKGSYQAALNEIEKTNPRFGKYEQWNLASKYHNLCQSAIYLMTLLPGDFRSEELVLAQEICSTQMQKLIHQEAQTLEELIIHKSDLLLLQNLKSYTDEYLINTRAQRFEEKMVRMVSNLFGVMRMIPKLIPQCN